MSIYAFKNISSSSLQKSYTTDQGKTYTLQYNDKMVGPTRFKGKGKSNSNAQGWERNSRRFFKEHAKAHPEMYSRINQAKIANNQNPRVDRQMIKHVPEYANYNGEKLIHHHIGGDGQAVGLPGSMHEGNGGVHNTEKSVGIRHECAQYSQKCQELADKRPDMYNQTVDDFHAQIDQQGQTATPAATKKSNTPTSQRNPSAQKSNTPASQRNPSAQKSNSPASQNSVVAKQTNQPTRSNLAANTSQTRPKGQGNGGQSTSSNASNRSTLAGQRSNATASSQTSGSGQSASSKTNRGTLAGQRSNATASGQTSGSGQSASSSKTNRGTLAGQRSNATASSQTSGSGQSASSNASNHSTLAGQRSSASSNGQSTGSGQSASGGGQTR